jgi:hypothetical protein
MTRVRQNTLRTYAWASDRVTTSGSQTVPDTLVSLGLTDVLGGDPCVQVPAFYTSVKHDNSWGHMPWRPIYTPIVNQSTQHGTPEIELNMGLLLDVAKWHSCQWRFHRLLPLKIMLLTVRHRANKLYCSTYPRYERYDFKSMNPLNTEVDGLPYHFASPAVYWQYISFEIWI